LQGVGAGAHEGLDAQVLLQRFEEQLDLPALAVDGSDGGGGKAGGGALFFSPTSKGSTVAGFTQGRPTFLYGAGIDWNAANNVSVRVGYRGLVYRAPDFAVPVQRTDAMANLAEPYVGVVFRF
jgi:opacity protein-like surface antigen